MADSNSKEELARRAQTQAEKCFNARNYVGAKQLIQCAVRLAPDLPSNAQLVAAYDVHAAATQKAPDRWYAVLDLPDPSSGGDIITHDAVKRQHRKLCLLVHPDKNSSAAAEGAFKHVQDAFDALSARHPPSAAVPADRTPQAPAPRPQDVQTQRRAPASRWWRQRPQTTSSNSKEAAGTRCKWSPMDVRGNCAVDSDDRCSTTWTPPRYANPSPAVSSACPACGAARSYSGIKGKFRCMSCKWSPMDGRRNYAVDYDDDYHYY